MRTVLWVVAPLGALIFTGCTGGGSSDCTLFCDSWYECTTTASMGSGSGSCNFPGTSAAAFRSLCVPRCDDIAGTLTEAERADTVSCLECMLGQVAPSECTNGGVADAANGPCEAACAQPGPDRFLGEISRDPEIAARCHSRPCAADTDCEGDQFCASNGLCLFPGQCANDDSDCAPDEFCSYDECLPR